MRDLLANGPAPGESVKAAAVNAKISERTLIAAAERLGVRCRRGECGCRVEGAALLRLAVKAAQLVPGRDQAALV